MDKVKVYFSGELPHSLLHLFVQHVRDFDAAHTDCHFEIMGNSEGQVAEEEMKRLFDSIDPPFPYRQIFRRK